MDHDDDQKFPKATSIPSTERIDPAREKLIEKILKRERVKLVREEKGTHGIRKRSPS